MKIVTLHSDYITFEPLKEAIPKPEKTKKVKQTVEECLVVFSAVEKNDEGKEKVVANNLVKEIKAVAEQVKAKRLVLYPWVHLTSDPASPSSALKVLKEAEKKLKKEFKVVRAPFGWYKQFELKCKGHPLAELSREIKAEEAKEEMKKNVIDKFLIAMPNGLLLSEDDVKEAMLEDTQKARIVSVIEEETGKPFFEVKEKAAHVQPIHSELAKKLGLATHAQISDAGCWGWLPKGALIKELIRTLTWRGIVDGLKCMPVSTPAIVKRNDPGVEWLCRHFPERQYKVFPGKAEKKQEFFLRTAGDYNVFSIFRSLNLSYKQLPLALYENERDYRYEQRGELKGLNRIREFEMHNVHAVCKDKQQAFDFFKKAFLEEIKLLKAIGFCPDAFLLYCKSELFNEYKHWALELAKHYKVPVIIELLKETAVYMGVWIDFLVFDSTNKPMEVATSQIDFDSAKPWNIKFSDETNKLKYPIIVHSGFGVERALAALLEVLASSELRHACLPYWLSPIQVRIVPIASRYNKEAKELALDLNYKEFVRTDVDDRPLHVEKKILEAEQEWIPYVVCLGKKELEKEILTVRFRETGKVQELKPVEFKNLLKSKQAELPWKPLPLPMLVSERPRF